MYSMELNTLKEKKKKNLRFIVLLKYFNLSTLMKDSFRSSFFFTTIFFLQVLPVLIVKQ